MKNTLIMHLLITAAIVFLTSITAFAERFSIEESFTHPVKIPAAIQSRLNAEMGEDIKHCEDVRPDTRYEAQMVKLSQSLSAYLLKPTNFCLCGVYYCPVWLYQMQGTQARRIWSTPATGNLEIMPAKTNGYHQLKEFGGTAGHGYKSVWSWNGKQYQEVYRQTYMTGSKACADVETFRLKSGKLVSVSNECLEELPAP
ncbi:hypothetical protein [Methylophilus sp.]|uniref:hypothetical protein n=1 Tax=Methylophilus sp. TaxID=29541 RepID=UPI0040368698